METTNFLLELKVKVNEIMAFKYDIQNINSIPTRQDVTFGDRACSFNAASLFIDIRNSTGLIEKYNHSAMANVLKAFHYINAKIVKQNYGEIRSFNGDGILAIFGEPAGCDNSVSAAFNIKFGLEQLLRPMFKKQEEFDYGIGIDFGKIFAVKVGISGEYNNDLIWVGSQVNNAFKMGNEAKSPDNIRISKRVFSSLTKINKIKPGYNPNDILSFLSGRNYEIWDELNLHSLLFGGAGYYQTDYERPV